MPKKTIPVLASENDWRDIADPVERRKRQNRMHQRNQRRKKKLPQPLYTPNSDPPWLGLGMLVIDSQIDNINYRACNLSSRSYDQPRTNFSIGAATPTILAAAIETKTTTANSPTGKVSRRLLEPDATDESRKTSRQRKLIPPLFWESEYSILTAVRHSPPAVVFPLYPEHRFITMVQYNVLRAVISNTSLISIPDILVCEEGETVVSTTLISPPPPTVPPDLRPTLLQQSVSHPPWINLVPFPTMRDNLVIHAGTFVISDLRNDICGCLWEGYDDAENRGWMIWGEPWDERNWELSEGFIRKWGFLVKGCQGLLESTNKWRQTRGEDILTIEV